MRVVFANLGAEEPGCASPVDGTPTGRLARAFTAIVHDPPWPALAEVEGLVPWLATDEATAEAARLGVPLAFAPAHVVRRVHDKAFALSCAQRCGLGVDDALSALACAFEPDTLTPAAIEAHMASWPDWARARATLKPRFGTSGRGRVAIRNGSLDDAGRAALARLRARGGAVLEPFVARSVDASALFFAPRVGEPELLGTTRQDVSVAGVYRGCTAVLDEGGRWRAGTAIDDVLERDAPVLVRAAQDEGFCGFCGVDAFSYEGSLRVRTTVELNARFTAGHIALALFSRAHPPARARLSFQLAEEPLVRPAIE